MSKTDMYTFKHVSDLAQIEDHDIDAFCSELPALLRNMREMVTGAELIASLTDVEIDRTTLIPYVTWKNDGKAETRVNVTANGESLATVTIPG